MNDTITTSKEIISEQHPAKAIFNYALRLGDTTLVLSQRYCEWVGKAPTLEEELALANIGLDTLGQATAWLNIASKNDVEERDADTLAYLRNERQYTNYLISELGNGDFAVTTLRGYLVSVYFKHLYEDMKNSNIDSFKSIAIKSAKEVQYHDIHQRAWILRLGNGTEESHQRLQSALDDLWAYTAELFEENEAVQSALSLGIIKSMDNVKQNWRKEVLALIEEANLTLPQEKYHHSSGPMNIHTEELGILLAEMQSLRRSYPNITEW